MVDIIVGILMVLFGVYIIGPFLRGFIDGINGIDETSEQSSTEDIKEKLAEITHVVREELHNGRSYWFDADDNAFIAWGDTQPELLDALKQRFPDHIFYLDKSNEIICKPDWTPTPFSTK